MTNDPSQPNDGFAALTGYRLALWQDDLAEVVVDLERKHMNRSGVLHGGLLATLIDVACGYAGTYCAVPGNVRRALTLSLTTQFIAAGLPGMHLTARGRRTGGGKGVFFADCEVTNENGLLIGRGEGVFKYRHGGGAPEGVPLDSLPPRPS